MVYCNTPTRLSRIDLIPFVGPPQPPPERLWIVSCTVFPEVALTAIGDVNIRKSTATAKTKTMFLYFMIPSSLMYINIHSLSATAQHMQQKPHLKPYAPTTLHALAWVVTMGPELSA